MHLIELTPIKPVRFKLNVNLRMDSTVEDVMVNRVITSVEKALEEQYKLSCSNLIPEKKDMDLKTMFIKHLKSRHHFKSGYPAGDHV